MRKILQISLKKQNKFFKQNKNNGKPVRKKLQHLQNSGKEEKIDVPTFSPPVTLIIFCNFEIKKVE